MNKTDFMGTWVFISLNFMLLANLCQNNKAKFFFIKKKFLQKVTNCYVLYRYYLIMKDVMMYVQITQFMSQHRGGGAGLITVCSACGGVCKRMFTVHNFL